MTILTLTNKPDQMSVEKVTTSVHLSVYTLYTAL